MKGRINNYIVSTISHEKCLPVSICKTKTHTIREKKHYMFTVTHNNV